MGLFTVMSRASSLTHRGRATSLFLHRYMSNVPENTVYGRPASQNPNERVTLAHLRQKHKKGEPRSFQIVRYTLWSKSWGPRPSDPEKALRVARNALKRAPLLIPIFNHCYIPCNPSLAGNPIFFVDENRIFCCGLDLSDFFERESLFRSSESNPQVFKKQRLVSKKSVGSSSNFSRRSLDTGFGSGARTTRWVEFWSNAVVDRHRRNSSSSSNYSPERFFDYAKVRNPKMGR